MTSISDEQMATAHDPELLAAQAEQRATRKIRAEALESLGVNEQIASSSVTLRRELDAIIQALVPNESRREGASRLLDDALARFVREVTAP